MIPDSIIDKIKSSLRIEQIIGEAVKLSKKGSSYTGLCPFHNEKSPSFTVTPDKGIWHCFGCGEGGDAIAFVSKHTGKSFIDSVKHLASVANITIEEEKPDPEAEKKAKKKESVFILNEFACKFFQTQMQKNDKALKISHYRFGIQNTSLWRIGFAPDSWNAFYDAARAAGYLEDFLIESGLVKCSERNHKVYDYFRNRLMFPIFNASGRITGFTGRRMDEDDTAKYINSPETIVYNKSAELYGIHLATRAIRNNGAVIAEGSPDVIKLHSVGAPQTVAPCGTSITQEQLSLLSKYTDCVTILTDGDAAGQKSMLRTGKMAIDAGFKVYCAILPEKQDPDSFFTEAKQYQEWMGTNRLDWVLHRAGILLDGVGQDPGKKNEAIKELCNYIFKFDKPSQQLYTEILSKQYKIKAKLFTDRLKDLSVATMEVPRDESLPAEVDARAFDIWGFYEYKNCYHVRGKSGVEEVSNFIMKPAFHIEGQNSRRIYELINFRGYRIVVDLNMMEMTSIQAFRKNVEGRGNFIFSGNDAQFTRIKAKLYEDTRTCREIVYLGWQREGFWAWANGITTEAGFTEIDEHGIVEFNDQHYFIPAFSSIHIDDKSVFIAERRFQLQENPEVKLADYARLFYQVFGDNSRIGLCFWVATVFRDYIFAVNKNFPILNLFGLKGTGKSQMAISLSCLFGEQQTPFNIHNGTKAGLAEHVQQFSNAFAWVDEYKNNLEYDKIETLKSIYDAIGRSRLTIERRKETTMVLAAMILSGQEMPTADIALFSRLIFLQFHKTNYTDAEKKLYDKLKNIERGGLSHLTASLLAFRKYFEKEYWNYYDDVLVDLSSEFQKEAVEDRILRNWAAIAAALQTLENKVDFGFTYKDIRPTIINGILDQNKQIGRSNEIGQFWELLEALFDEGILIDGWHFRIKYLDALNTTRGEKKLSPPIHVLQFKFSTIAKFYSEHMRRSGVKPLPTDTLRYYLENSTHFLGVCSSVRFIKKEFKSEEGKAIEEKTVTTAYCFAYKALNINLDRSPIGSIEGSNSEFFEKPDLELQINRTEGKQVSANFYAANNTTHPPF